MSLKLQYSKVIETGGRRTVEMLFAKTPAPELDEVQIRIVVPVSEQGYPRTAAAQLEALRGVRNAIDNEIQRLQHIHGQAYQREDW